MKKYIVNISGTSNILGDSKFFIGTGFLGAEFSTKKELIEILRKYAMVNGIWREEIKLTFKLGETVASFVDNGNKQCKDNGFVDLLKAASVVSKDPFYNKTIIYRPSGWIDKDGNTFAFVLIDGDSVIPKDMKLTDILLEMGINI